MPKYCIKCFAFKFKGFKRINFQSILKCKHFENMNKYYLLAYYETQSVFI